MMSISFDSGTATAATPIITVLQANFAAFLDAESPKIRAWLAVSGFSAKPHTFALIPNDDGKIEKIIVGVSSASDIFALSHLPFQLPHGQYRLLNGALTDYAAVLSWQLGTYQFSRYKKSPKSASTLVFQPSAEATRAVEMGEAIALTRDLVNTPTEDMGPQHLSEAAKKIASEFGGAFREIVGDELLTQNFPAIHAVGRASHRPPRLIEIVWGDPTHPKVAVVGKGVCFDTGGLNIKGADGMRQMKKDMGGGAHAIALARLIMQANLPVRLQMLVPAVENAIAGNAYRPGEIVATRAGLQIEIGNTDAEGRVVLSDALTLAAEAKPALIIDFATLTGAARVALGPELPATFANDDTWFNKLNQAATASQDPIWRMPLWQPYNDMIKSNIGDIINTGGPQAGAVTAALFLEHFIPQGQAWIHIDTFAWNLKSRPGRPDGGEALSLRAAFTMLESHYKRN
jgi:leucyl aminopeptidase